MLQALSPFILDYMASVAPHEGCGFIVDGQWLPCPNVSREPLEHCEPAYTPERYDAFVHSHPGGPAYPSNLDMASQIASDRTWGIAADDHVFFWGDTAPKLPLLARPFRHGVTDCYEAVRDVYRRLGVDLAPYARAWRWHVRTGIDMYMDGFASEGFHAIEPARILPGDAILFMVNSRVFNHAGVYVGEGLIYHHLATSRNGFDPSTLATIDHVSMFGDMPKKVLRHEKHSTSWTFRPDFWT